MHLDPLIDFWEMVGGECTGSDHIPYKITVFAHLQHHVAQASLVGQKAEADHGRFDCDRSDTTEPAFELAGVSQSLSIVI